LGSGGWRGARSRTPINLFSDCVNHKLFKEETPGDQGRKRDAAGKRHVCSEASDHKSEKIFMNSNFRPSSKTAAHSAITAIPLLVIH